MVEDIQAQIKIHSEERDRAAFRYAKFDDKKDQAEFEKQDYVIEILISLLPK